MKILKLMAPLDRPCVACAYHGTTETNLIRHTEIQDFTAFQASGCEPSFFSITVD